MHKTEFSPRVIERVIARQGALRAIERFDPAKTAVIVIDMQNFFMAEGEPVETPVAREIVPNINRLAQAARRTGAMVVWVAMEAPADSATSWPSLRAITKPAAFDKRLGLLKKDTYSYGFWPELDIAPDEPVVVKTRYSALIAGSSNLESLLRARGIDTAIITGVATNVCCESTARDAMMLNFTTIMVSDANAASTDELHNAALATFYTNFGEVQTTDQVIEGLANGARQAAE